jgi:Uma2 family endonuclease
MGAFAYEEYYTTSDYQQWEGDWELIHGTAYAMAPSPMVTHQFVSTKITHELMQILQNCPNCMVMGEIDWEVSSDTVVKPDALVICKEIEEKVNKTPEIIFEVISPSTAKRDEVLKFDIYEKEGVKYYTLVYPKNRIAKVYKLNQEGRLIKQGDFENESFTFEIDRCRADFDFRTIWR